jgi:hypothetical protein
MMRPGEAAGEREKGAEDFGRSSFAFRAAGERRAPVARFYIVYGFRDCEFEFQSLSTVESSPEVFLV